MARGSKQSELLKKAATITLSPDEKLFLGLKSTSSKEKHSETPYVVLKYYNPKHECFSTWDSNELRAFSNFVIKLKECTWNQIFNQGGKKGGKSGFGLTYHSDRNKLPKHPELDKISEDIRFFELRVSKEMRVHGFRVKDAFFLVWLDKDHQVYPE